ARPVRNGAADVDVSEADLKDIPPAAFTFVPEQYLADEKLREHFEPATRNVTLLDRTQDATRYEPAEGHVVERGLSPDTIEEATGRPVKRYRVTDAPAAAAAKVSGDEVKVYAPSAAAVA